MCPNTYGRGEHREVTNGARVTEDPESNDEGYNYDRFGFDEYAVARDRGVEAGDEAVDATLYDRSGRRVELSEYWAERPVVVEFGSVTCPIFVETLRAMDRLAERYADDVTFLVVYTREAHPGGRIGPHGSFEEKLDRADRLHAVDRPRREVLVDDLDGTAHRAYDAMPNSVYLVGTDGVVSHRADWSDPDALATAIESLLAAGGRGSRVEPTSIEDNFQAPTPSFLRTLVEVLGRAGPGSRRDLLRSLPSMLVHRLRVRLEG